MNDLQTNAVFGDIAPVPGFAEPVSSWLHLAAAGVMAAGAWHYFRPAWRQPAWRAATLTFVIAAVFLFSMSGTYHLLEPDGEPRAVLQRLDHAAIWTLIAGTFTPIHVMATRGIWRWGCLAVVWSAAIAGLVLKTVYFHEMSEMVGLVFYLSLGWMGVISTWQVWKNAGWVHAQWLMWGGLAYSIGAILEFSRWPTLVEHVVGPHELFHVAVIFGVGVHALMVRRLALRSEGQPSSLRRGPLWPDRVAAANLSRFAGTPAEVRPSRRVPTSSRGRRWRGTERSDDFAVVPEVERGPASDTVAPTPDRP